MLTIDEKLEMVAELQKAVPDNCNWYFNQGGQLSFKLAETLFAQWVTGTKEIPFLEFYISEKVGDEIGGKKRRGAYQPRTKVKRAKKVKKAVVSSYNSYRSNSVDLTSLERAYGGL